MRKIMYIFVLIALMFIRCSSILDTAYNYTIINFSNENIIFVVSNSDSLGTGYIDLSNRYFIAYDEWKPLIKDSQYCYIKKSSKKSVNSSGTSSELFTNRKDHRVRFYFISESIFMKYPWDTIVKRQMYNKKFVYTEEQMDSLGWVIEYR